MVNFEILENFDENNNRINSRLLIDCTYFKNINKNNLFEGVDKPFFYIYEKYYRLKKSSSNLVEFNKKLINHKDNSKLFYTGVEEYLKSKLNKRTNDVNSNISKFIANHNIKKDSILCTPYHIKTFIKTKNGKGKRLLSILLRITYKNSFDPTMYLDILFPIEYDDVHC